MPSDQNGGLVDIRVDADTGAPALETKSKYGILAHYTSDELPADLEFGRAYTPGAPEAVADLTGDGSPAHLEAQAARAEGYTAFVVAIAERTLYEGETLDGTDNSVASSGIVSNVPITGYGDGVNADGNAVTVTVDGGDPIPADPVVTSPPTLDGDPPAAGEALANADTGEIVISDQTAGTGSGGIAATYESLDWGPALRALQNASVDILTVATERYDRSNIGDWDEVTTWAESYDVTVPLPFVRGTTLDPSAGPQSIVAEQDLAQDVGGYAPCKYAAPVSNSSTAPVGGRIAGRLGVNEAEYDLFQKEFGVNAGDENRYTTDNIGNPETPGTFEGGDGGAGPANVLYQSDATKLSNGLTTAGIESDYRFLDIARSEAFIKAKAGNAASAVIGEDDFRFNGTGQTMLVDALDDVLNPIAARDAYNFIDVNVPRADELSREMRANRFWQGIVVTVGFASTVHRVGMTVSFTLATENPELATDEEQTIGQTAPA